MKVQILGTGCPKCNLLAERVATAAQEAGLEIELSKVTEISEIIAFGVMSTPALVLDGVVLLSGKVPTVPAIRELLNR